MPFPTRLLFSGGAAVAVLFAALALLSLSGSLMGLDLATLRELRDTFERELARGKEMDAEIRVVEDRLIRRDRVAQDFIAGRLGLREAAARYRAIERERPGFSDRADEENSFRQLIARMKAVASE